MASKVAMFALMVAVSLANIFAALIGTSIAMIALNAAVGAASGILAGCVLAAICEEYGLFRTGLEDDECGS